MGGVIPSLFFTRKNRKMKYITQADLDDMYLLTDFRKNLLDNLEYRFIQFKKIIGNSCQIIEITNGKYETFVQDKDFEIIDLNEQGEFERYDIERNEWITEIYEEF